MNIKGKTFFVFLENKIISLDSIIPFALELNSKCGAKFTFLVFDKVTNNAIIEDNDTLYDAIKSVGRLEYIYGANDRSKIKKISRLIYRFILISFQVNFKGGYILDFGGLNVTPLVYTRYLYPSKRRILSESSSSGRTLHKDIIYKGGVVTKILQNIYHYRTDNMDCFKDKDKYFPLNASILLGFHKSWNFFKHKDAAKTKQILFSNSRNSPALTKNYNTYINSELRILNSNSKFIISIVIGRLKYDNDLTKLHRNAFKHTLISLAKYSRDFPVFIKPKIYDDMIKLKKLIDEVDQEYSLNYILTKSHPLVLSKRSIMSVFVSETSVISDFYISGVPIVQNLIGFSGDYLDKNISPLADYITTESSQDFDKVVKKIIDNSVYTINKPKKIENNLNCNFL